MAADPADLSYVEHWGTSTTAILWRYDTTDNVAATKDPDYFDPLGYLVRGDDVVRVYASDGKWMWRAAGTGPSLQASQIAGDVNSF